jgi:hypothetical protein
MALQDYARTALVSALGVAPYLAAVSASGHQTGIAPELR